MTKLQAGKKMTRETAALDRRRPIVVDLFPFYVGVRVKGTREFYSIPWDCILDLGRKIDARQKLAARKGAA